MMYVGGSLRPILQLIVGSQERLVYLTSSVAQGSQIVWHIHGVDDLAALRWISKVSSLSHWQCSLGVPDCVTYSWSGRTGF